MRSGFALCIATVALCCSWGCADALTFEGIPSGTVLFGSAYGYAHRVSFSPDFYVADHTGSSWGPPHSGSNVVISSGSAYSRILFGYYTASEAEPDPIQSVGAYFSTQTGVMVRITAYHWVPPATSVAVTDVVIGAAGESWNNRYIEVTTSPGSTFEYLKFEGVNSSDDLLGFCADDMTILPVPEPGGLIGLVSGLGMLGIPLVRRRRTK